jgi:hypothetical protein
MSRSPLAYPLNRAADTDVGGAADLQTDVMRFMAILALCLVAIFALVQSIPMAPAPETPPQIEEIDPQPAPAGELPDASPETAQTAPTMPSATAAKPAADKVPVLTRPKWTPKAAPRQTVDPAKPTPPAASESPPATPIDPEPDGFTLRFASDAALMRAVAAHRVGVYAIEAARARRMTVSDSRISFWDASMPNSFHEMERSTVPVPVVDALLRAGPEPDDVKWGVTLPGRMKSQLDALMEQHGGGALIIGTDGEIHWEALQ